MLLDYPAIASCTALSKDIAESARLVLDKNTCLGSQRTTSDFT